MKYYDYGQDQKHLYIRLNDSKINKDINLFNKLNDKYGNYAFEPFPLYDIYMRELYKLELQENEQLKPVEEQKIYGKQC